MNGAVTLNDAITIANKYMGSTKKFNIEADDSNSAWEEYIRLYPPVLETDMIKKMELHTKQYWAIYFTPKKDFWGRVTEGGDTLVFIDKSNGNIIGVLLGE